MASGNQLENSLKEIFVDKAPALPAGGKKFLVQWAPWLSVIGGLLALYSAWMLWHWAHIANAFINYANAVSAVYGGGVVASSRMTLGIWLSVLVLVIEGILYLLAYSGLRDHKKNGWNMLYYALLVNIVYGVVVMFTNYGGVGNLLGSLIGAAIGLYLLFQIRSSYLHKATAASTRPEAPEK